jgi:molybdenum cofactor synthesis domain-containing protein
LIQAGITEVVAHRKPVVGVLSTGSELVEAFQGATTPGKIRDSNRPMLLALLNGWGAKTLNLGVCSDNKQALKDAMLKALETVDVLITSGGVSMGDHDLIKPLLEEMGTVHFGRLLMKPGKPTTFATLAVQGKKKMVFALPGNPVSSFTTCHLLVHPVLRRLRGLPVSKCQHTKVYAALTHPIKLDAERPEFHRATLTWDGKQHKFLATSTGRQISSRLLRFAQHLPIPLWLRLTRPNRLAAATPTRCSVYPRERKYATEMPLRRFYWITRSETPRTSVWQHRSRARRWRPQPNERESPAMPRRRFSAPGC